jgi:lipoate-protein ligase A
MGEVGSVRSFGIPHAVAGSMGPDSDPALILLRPASAVVSVDQTAQADAEVDLAFCAAQQIPVARRRGGLGAILVDPNHLLFALAFPRSRTEELGLPRKIEGLYEQLTEVLVSVHRALDLEASFRAPNLVEVNGSRIAETTLLDLGEGLCWLGSLTLSLDEELREKVLRGRIEESVTSLERELGRPADLAKVAEELVGALETQAGFELIPSMPMPHEMDAIYQWDLRLAGSTDPVRQHPLTTGTAG